MSVFLLILFSAIITVMHFMFNILSQKIVFFIYAYTSTKGIKNFSCFYALCKWYHRVICTLLLFSKNYAFIMITEKLYIKNLYI